MRQWIIFALLCLLACPASAGDWTTNRNAAVWYYYSQTVSTNIPTDKADIDALFIINENGVDWKIGGTPAPTIAQLNDNVDVASGWWALHPSSPANDDAPATGWKNLSRREKFLIKCLYELAKIHYPAMTFKQYQAQLQIIWNDTH